MRRWFKKVATVTAEASIVTVATTVVAVVVTKVVSKALEK